jgi:hypothetical protein
MEFPHKCTIAQKTSGDAWHNYTFGRATSTDCYYEEVKEIKGNEVVVSAYVALPPNTQIYSTSQITLPDGEKPKITVIKPIERISDHAVEYIRVLLGNPYSIGELV